jgi:hypothetical protein
MFYVIEITIGICFLSIIISGTIKKVIRNIRKGFKD